MIFGKLRPCDQQVQVIQNQRHTKTMTNYYNKFAEFGA